MVGTVTDLYPTEIKTAFETSVQRTEQRQYDFLSGLVNRATDADNNVSTSTTYDVFGRPRLMQAAENKVEETRSLTEYSDTNRRVITRSDLNTLDDGKLVTITHFDQLGRVRLSRQLEDSATQSTTDETTGIKVQARYMFSGSNSYTLTSNPYRAANSGAANVESTMGWTRTKSDNGGRLIEVQTFGGVLLPAPWSSNTIGTGSVITTYDAQFTTVTDQAGRSRRSMSDALGRLVRIDEPDQTYNLGATASPVQPTNYLYDPLGNLLEVVQGQQHRYFMYDSLSRLRRAANPEQQTNSNLSPLSDPITANSNWSMGYVYDNNSNLTTRTDARNIVTQYLYDELNRLKTRSYSDGTPTVTYNYDAVGVPYSKGRLTSISSSVSSYSYSEYDALGRVLAGIQTIGAKNYGLTYTYDLAGHVRMIRFPSGRTVNYTYDTAGRTSSFVGNLGDGTQRNYVSGIVYDAGGRMTQEQFGTATPIYNKLFYNSRGQLAEIREGTTPNNTDWERGAIINHYSGCWGMCYDSSAHTASPMPDNNGNLQRQEVHIPGTQNFAQFYEYDSLNRLQSVRENRNGGPVNWQQTYTYDRYGNRSINAGATSGSGINNLQAAVVQNTMTNRMYAQGETEQNHPLINYDAAGNQIKDYYSDPIIDFDRSYNAENLMTTSTATGAGQNSTYGYDGNNRRVRRNVAGVETWQVYGFGGEFLAEYAANAEASSPQKEYGYRNGQLIITGESTVASAPAPSALLTSPNSANVSLNWTAASGASNYRIERKAAGGNYVFAGNSATTSFIDSGVSSGNAYLYQVCAADAQNNCLSAYTNVALGAPLNFSTDATIISILDDPTGLTVTSMKAAHITELRTAVNAVRHLAGLADATWTYPNVAIGGIIHVEDVRDLRVKLGDALTLLGIQLPSYTDSTIKGFLEDPANATTIKAAHIRELRQASTKGSGTGAGAGSTTPKIRWLVSDHLGTPRMTFDQTGALDQMSHHDYLPFGEELFAGIGGRITDFGYPEVTNDRGKDGARQKFTQKERDIETGLDYFLARYYSSTQGRFTSPDEFSGGPDELYDFTETASENPTFYADLTNPQSLNKYQYTYNNPVNLTDEDGHCPICAAVVEVAGTVVDVVITVQTLRDPNASTAEKVGTVVGTAAGVILPAGGYSAAIKAIVRTGKQANNLPAPNQVAPTQKGDYSNIKDPKNPREGGDFTKRQKLEARDQNKRDNGGQMKSDGDGKPLNGPVRTGAGQKRDPREAQLDHKTSKANGGTNRSSNIRVISGQENQRKGKRNLVSRL